jgi:hypothetical protein
VFSRLVVFEIRTSTVASVVRYSAQKCSVEHKLFILYLKYNILRGRREVESFIGSILTVQFCVKQRFTTKLHPTRSMLEKKQF